mmetsp:Transcript_58702/g.137454  ORF Transcript_58702/g.137454 Transcript_58702/m.137454 type:complete len:438 (-) Transcript_58702:229-1542(-)
MDAAAPAAKLAEYLQAAYIQDTALETDVINDLLTQIPPGDIDWSIEPGDDGMPALHYACMNEATDPPQLFQAIGLLLQSGADPKVKDADGDTALDAVLSLAGQDPESADEQCLQANLAAVRALIRCTQQELGSSELSSVCNWLRHHIPQSQHKEVLVDLEMRVGPDAVKRAWTSEMFLKYLEDSAYEGKRPLQASIVEQFLSAGASPSVSQNGASALLLMALNPYSSYDEMLPICRMMVEKEPNVVCLRDGFKLSALDWASDYDNIAAQHNVKPNPACLLALLPAIVELAPTMAEDSGVRCLKVTARGYTGAAPPASIRFLEGDRVVCRVEAPGGKSAWEEGVVIALWYREKGWPTQFRGAPYQVKLDIGLEVYALADHDALIRKEAKESLKEAKGSSAPSGGRFRKQQRDDGRWELLDTQSGKARPCSPPDSDEED